ncbi:DUF4249 domain-containing protein [Mucilaginibacter sp.]|uniref:DUF4249 domain-containing protein n=1 Tax=Mucilaginibacter sp. TaxID=1882438 RepID=UPI003262F045
MKGRNICICILGLGAAVAGCRKTYAPQVVSSGNTLLVVEGVIDPGSDSTFIKLSHTVKISDTTKVAAEKGATLTVEGNGLSVPLTELRPGVYACPPLNADATQKYRLRVKLSNGKEYLSDDEEAKVTPPIDTITYEPTFRGLKISASAHDPSGKTRYYRWDYDEDWRFNAKFFSSYKVVNGVIFPRTPADLRFSCFSSHASTVVVLGSSVKLAQDVISDQPILTIDSTSEKISIRYSILLKQYALSKAAFGFYENIKKNTEQLGSIFDAQPSEIAGNVHSTTNPAEPVIGYVSVCTVQSKRIFIDKTELPAKWITKYPYDCRQDTTWFSNPITGAPEVKAFILTNLTLPTQEIAGVGTALLGYYRTDFICGDCTLRGTQKRPVFWKDK